MIRELTPWTQLTRNGIPPLRVIRRPLVFTDRTVEIGEVVDPELFPAQIRRERLRQFYEMRRLEPVTPLPDSRQYYREREAAALAEQPVTPITPVASRIVASLPEVEVPVETVRDRFKAKPKGGK